MYYNIAQLSLKEYNITNNSTSLDLTLEVLQFRAGSYNSIFDDPIIIEPEATYKLILPRDGLFKLYISNEEYPSTVIVNNITELLEKKQKFLTEILLRPNIDKCDHNQYYDLISFNIIFDTYNKLVKDSFTEETIPEDQLYEIEYLLTRLKEF